MDKKKEIEYELIYVFTTIIGMDIPSGFDNILEYVYEDVCETADDDWNTDDVLIAFRRWIESKAIGESF